MKAVSKVVIPAAGLGTRLLSATKEQPKEMLPIFSKTENGELCVKPVLQLIYEQLFDFGFRNFYFIVGRNKRAIEDHFTPDRDFIDSLNRKGKSSHAKELARFYEKLSLSSIVWINQSAPLGFGHAVLMAKNLVKDDPFLVHAGDTIISSKN
ncbi:MAG: sugar phosphate nucleotidyltransferase, partial [Thermoproteota archaeon]